MTDSFRANRYQSKSLIKCNFCGRVAHHTYKIPFGEFTYNLCSGQCIETSRQNYEKNKNINFVDSTLRSPDLTPEMVEGMDYD